MATPEKSPLTQQLAPLFGSNGFVVETGVTPITGDFYVIKFVEDTVFAALTMNNNGASTGDSLVGKTFKAGDSLPNALGITAFTLTSGSVIAYNR